MIEIVPKVCNHSILIALLMAGCFESGSNDFIYENVLQSNDEILAGAKLIWGNNNYRYRAHLVYYSYHVL